MKVFIGVGGLILVVFLLVVVLALIAGAVVTSPVWGLCVMVSIIVNRNRPQEIIEAEKPSGSGSKILDYIQTVYENANNKKRSPVDGELQRI